METPVTILRDQQQLIGMLHLPEPSSGRVPAVLFLHGFTGGKAEGHRLFVEVARRLAGEGIASLRLDFMGSGDSAGDFRDCTVDTQVLDTHAALAWMRDHPGLDPERLGLVGISLGGMVAALALGDDPALKAGVLLCPVGDPEGAAQRRGGSESIQQLGTRGWTDMGGYAVSRAFFHSLLSARPLERVVATRAAIQVIQGDKDETVLVDESRLYQEALQQAGCTSARHIIEGADHNFRSIPWKTRVIDLASGWFATHL